MLIRQILIGVLLVTFTALTVWGIWHLTRVPALTISTVTAAGGITIEPATVVALAEEELRGEYYRLIPKRFSYLYPEETIRERLETIPRIKNVRLERQQRTTLAITYDEYEPFALWCNERGEECVFIDQGGFGFAAAPALRGGAFVRYHNRLVAPEVGAVGVTEDLLEETNIAARTMASELGLRVNTVVLDDRDVIYELGGGGEIRTVQSDDVETILNNLETILTSDEFSHLEPGNFEYVDLRYGNKVFVQEDLPEMATSTATTSPTLED
jgi:cell division septal protein FtsQ